jgi:hypothetical protein
MLFKISQVGNICFKSVVIAFGLALILFSAIFVRINHSPYNLDEYLPKLEKYFVYQGHSLKFQHLFLGFDGGLTLEGKGAKLFSPEGEVQMQADTIRMKLSNRNLVRGRAIPKHVEVDGFKLSISIAKEGVTIIGRTFKPNKDAKRISLIEFLNQETHPRIYETLKTIRLKNVDLYIADQVYGRDWFFDKASLQFTKLFLRGERLEINGNVRREKAETISIPVKVSLDHPTKSQTAQLTLSFENSDTEIISDYLPEKMRELLNARGKIQLIATVKNDRRLHNPQFIMDLGEGSFHPQGAYEFPLTFKNAYIKGSYSKQKADTLTLEEVNITDSEGVDIKASGKISQLATNPMVDVKASASNSTFRHFLGYLPDRMLPVTLGWLRNHMHHAQVSDVKLHYSGRPKELPSCKKECGFNGSFNYTDLTLKFLEDLPPATGLNGTFKIREDNITVTSPSGIIAGQKATDIQVKISELFTPNTKETIQITGTTAGATNEAIDLVVKAIKVDANQVTQVQGNHVSTVDLAFPLGKKDLALSDFKFNVESDLTDTQTDVAEFSNIRFRAPIASLKVTQKALNFVADGHLGDIPVNATWQESVASFGQKTKVGLIGVLAADKIKGQLARVGADISGTLPFKLDIEKLLDGQGYSYDISSNLEATQASLTKLNWFKPKGTPIKVQATGTLNAGGNKVHGEVVSIVGEGIEILGQFFVDNNQEENNLFSFDPFMLGKTKARLNYKNNTLSLKGSKVDLSNFSLKNQESEKSNSNLNVDFHLNEVLLKHGALYLAKGGLTLLNGELSTFNLDSKLSDNSTFNAGVYTTEKSKQRIANLLAGNAGLALKTLGIYNDIERGELFAEAVLSATGKKPVTGQGLVEIKNAQLVKAPVLAQLLSLVSLQELFSSKDGIYFELIKAPFKLKDTQLTLDDVRMNGPSIGLRYEGKLDYETENMSFNGRLIPAEGVNKIFGKIPLVGKILTGSQEGLLVADFSVKGTFDDPDVSVNPLSVVTPGIIKDFFGAIVGDDDHALPAKK